jgi:type I restriction enzyme S subunit
LFAIAWEQRKLGDMGSVAMNKRIFKEQTTEVGDVPFYKIGTFGGEPDAFISRKLFEEYKSKYSYPEVGDILISASGSIGRTVEYTGKDEYFQDSNIVWLQHDEQLDNSFLKHFYSIVKWHGLEGSTIKRLYNKNILDTRINVPMPKEQNAVGSFFDRFDRLITLHQRKYDKLQNIKKSLLEKMFPPPGGEYEEVNYRYG